MTDNLTRRFLLYGLTFEFFYISLALLGFFKDITIGDTHTPSEQPIIFVLHALWSTVSLMFFAILLWRLRPTRTDASSVTTFTRGNLTLWVILGCSLLFAVTVTAAWPFGSVDIFNYIFRARVFTVYGHNPYFTPPAVFPTDLADVFVGRFARLLPMIYGPAWTALTFIPSALFGNHIILLVWVFRLIAVAFSTGSAYLIYRILSVTKPAYRYWGTILYAWNPFVLFEFAQNGHNDAAMIFFVLLALNYYVSGRYSWVLPALTMSILMKYQTVVLVPFLLLGLWRITRGQRFATIVAPACVSLALVVGFFAPFWQGWEIFSPVTAIQLLPRAGPSVLALAFEYYGGLDIGKARAQSLLIFFASAAMLGLWALWSSAWERLSRTLFWIFMCLLIFGTFWLMPWYFVLAVALAAVVGDSAYVAGGVLVSVFALLSYQLPYIIFGPILLPFVVVIVWLARSRNELKFR